MPSHLVGHERAALYLERLLERERVPSALLFLGPEGIGKGLFADAFAKKWIAGLFSCDLHHYRPEGKLGLYALDTIRLLLQEMALPPYAARRKAFILHDADCMLPSSANALLKTLEEPPSDTLLILTAVAKERLLPTLLSRVHLVRFFPLTEEEIARVLTRDYGYDAKEAEQAAFQARGSLGRALRSGKGEQEEARRLLLPLLEAKNSYLQLSERIEQIVQWRERQQQQWEEEGGTEGEVALKAQAEIEALLQLLLEWFRDLHLLRCGADPLYLSYPAWRPSLEKRLQRPFPSLEKALTVVEKAKVASQRSFPLSHCLETLFLELGCV